MTPQQKDALLAAVSKYGTACVMQGKAQEGIGDVYATTADAKPDGWGE